MSGQSTWNAPGSSTNAYIVNPVMVPDIYYKATYKTIFGKMNGNRKIEQKTIAFQDQKITIDVGNDSPVWEKTFNSVGEARFTMVEEMNGMATYGDADVKPGEFDSFKHAVCYVNQIDSPVKPLPGSESLYNVSDVIDDYIPIVKGGLTQWASKEMDIDAFRAIFLGASRGLLATADGGKGVAMAGATAGQYRSCYNTYVEGQTGLTTPSYTRATHESTLSTLVNALTDNATYAFDWDSHKRAAYFIDRLNFKATKAQGGPEVRAIALIDERNIYRMTAANYTGGATAINGVLFDLWKNADARGEKNPVFNNRGYIILDEIMYIPCKQLEFFRPTTDGSTLTYGCGMNSDPRTYTNTSNITTTVYMGAGALLRGGRRTSWITIDDGSGARHGKGKSYCFHYHDGWTRKEWFTKDDRSAIDNDSMLVCFNYDKGVATNYTA
jgi:hypothetical protein